MATLHFSLNSAVYHKRPLRGEVAFIYALKCSLPDDFHIFANCEWISRSNEKINWAGGLGEIDVIIFHRSWGFLCVEVKGGHKNEFNSSTKDWFQSCGASKNLENRDHDPVKQARKGSFQLKKWITSEVLDKRPRDFLFGYAIAFPDGVFSCAEDVMPMNLVREIILESSDLFKIQDAIESVFKYWSEKLTREQGFSFREVPTEVVKWVLDALDGKYAVIETPSIALQHANHEMIRMTSDQERAHLALNCRRLAVVGPAGTGKTVLAIARARLWASQGKSVLFLSYNKLLAQHLKIQLCPLKVEVNSLHGFIARYRKSSLFEDRLPGGLTVDERYQLSVVLLDVVEQCSVRYDSIIIDEAQDFAADWISILEGLIKSPKNGEIHIYMDPKQDVFGLYDADSFKVYKETTFSLKQNLRNTRPICIESYKFGNIKSYDPPPFAGSAIEVARGQTVVDIVKEVNKTIDTWCSSDYSLKLEEIVILSPVHLDKSCLANSLNLPGSAKNVPCGKYSVVEGFQGKEGLVKNQILYYTIQSFKGCEANAVIFLERDLRASGVDAEDVKRYIGYSRAKLLLKIIH